jgi:hypothetical protein
MTTLPDISALLDAFTLGEQAIMSGHNRVEGTFMAHDELLLMRDWFVAVGTVQGVLANCDLVMHGPIRALG